MSDYVSFRERDTSQSIRPTLLTIEDPIRAKLPDPSTMRPAHTVAAWSPSTLEELATATTKIPSAAKPSNSPRPNRIVRYQRETTLNASESLLTEALLTSNPTMSSPIGMMVASTPAPSAVIMPRTLSGVAR